MNGGDSITNGLNRRNSVPSAVAIPNGDHRTNSFELVYFKFPATATTASYTSLKDIIPSSPSSLLSPSPASNSAAAASGGGGGGGLSSPPSGSGYEISIRNRLVKQAAWAYLQPTVPSSPSSSSPCLCFSGELFRPLVSRFRQFFCETVTRVYDWMADVLWLILCR